METGEVTGAPSDDIQNETVDVKIKQLIYQNTIAGNIETNQNQH